MPVVSLVMPFSVKVVTYLYSFFSLIASSLNCNSFGAQFSEFNKIFTKGFDVVPLRSTAPAEAVSAKGKNNQA